MDVKVKEFVNEVSEESGQTPLMFACMKNKLNLVKILLDYDACSDVKDVNGKNAAGYAKNNESCLFLLNSFSKMKKITMKKKSCNEVDKKPIEQCLSANNFRKSDLSFLSCVSVSRRSMSSVDLHKTSF